MTAQTRPRARNLALTLATLATGLTSVPAVAHTAQYPPNQYPSGQYPSGQYPAAQYPAQPAPAQPIDGDLYHTPQPAPAYPAANPNYPPATPAYAQGAPQSVPNGPPGSTYRQDDLIGAAEGVFGKGAHGLADVIHDILRKQGEPVGYIVGREAGGAFAVGLRYGSGNLYLKAGGERPVYWTGPSIGFDVGANADKAFVLVYNLRDIEDVYHRYGAGEGQAYLVGGFHVSYLRRGDVVLSPVRMGVGLRLGINGGYIKFSRTQNWLPF